MQLRSINTCDTVPYSFCWDLEITALNIKRGCVVDILFVRMVIKRTRVRVIPRSALLVLLQRSRNERYMRLDLLRKFVFYEEIERCDKFSIVYRRVELQNLPTLEIRSLTYLRHRKTNE